MPEPDSVSLPPQPVVLHTDDGVRLVADHWPARDRAAAIGCVVAHGFTMSAANAHLLRICAALQSAGFGVLAPDLRGHGRSGGLGTAGDAEIHDIAAAVAWLRQAGYRRVVTVGWSMGGTSVLRHAGLDGDSDAVVSVSAPGTWFERSTRAMRIVHWMFEHRTGRLVARYLRRTRVSPVGWDPIPASPAEAAAAIAPRPLLIVHGAADRYFPLHHPESIAAAAPTATVWIEPEMGHAEVATDADLLDRIAGWIDGAVQQVRGPVTDADRAGIASAVCDDDPRD